MSPCPGLVESPDLNSCLHIAEMCRILLKMYRANPHFYIFSNVCLWSKFFNSLKDHVLFRYSPTKEKSVSSPPFLSMLIKSH